MFEYGLRRDFERDLMRFGRAWKAPVNKSRAKGNNVSRFKHHELRPSTAALSGMWIPLQLVYPNSDVQTRRQAD